MKAKLLIALIVPLTICGEVSAWAREICKGNPSITGPCFDIRGRLTLYNGFPNIRMWWIGTKRIFGIAGGEGEEIMPEDLKVADGVFIYGDFRVCPMTDHEPGHMQYVCIESAKNLRIERLSVGRELPKMRAPDSSR